MASVLPKLPGKKNQMSQGFSSVVPSPASQAQGSEFDPSTKKKKKKRKEPDISTALSLNQKASPDLRVHFTCDQLDT